MAEPTLEKSGVLLKRTTNGYTWSIAVQALDESPEELAGSVETALATDALLSAHFPTLGARRAAG